MNIVVCLKITSDPSDIAFNPDGAINLSRAEWAINTFDLQALEAGVRLAEALPGSQVTVISAGPEKIDNSKLKKDILSRGPDALVMIADARLQHADSALTSGVLAAAIKRAGPVDLVLCGEGSADLYYQETGVMLGEKLGTPTTNAVRAITPEGDHLLVERDLESEVEVLEVPLPAALSVTTDIHPPRLPTMKAILAAAKKPVTIYKLDDLNLDPAVQDRSQTIQTYAPPRPERKQVIIEGSPDEEAAKLLDALRKEGVA